jgi:hypothetical protein
VTISSYAASHTEPPPTPTPTPAPTYTFTFTNNYQPGNNFNLYLNTDGNSSSGYATGGAGGAEYLIQNNQLFQYIGPGWNWGPLSCSSLTFSAGPTTTWTLSQACLSALNNGNSVVFQRLSNSWSALYTSPSVTISSYAASHTEPPPTPTPTPVPTYTFTFTNNYQLGNNFNLYLNTDGNSSSGYATGGAGGAEYLIQNYQLFQYIGPGWNWGPLSCSSLTFSAGPTTTWTLSQACLSALNNGNSVVFQRLSNSWSALYTSPSVTISSYSASHTEPTPTPTPTSP